MALFSPQKKTVGWPCYHQPCGAMTGVGSSSGNHVPFLGNMGRREGARLGRALGVEKPQRFIAI